MLWLSTLKADDTENEWPDSIDGFTVLPDVWEGS